MRAFWSVAGGTARKATLWTALAEPPIWVVLRGRASEADDPSGSVPQHVWRVGDAVRALVPKTTRSTSAEPYTAVAWVCGPYLGGIARFIRRTIAGHLVVACRYRFCYS
jgi:hypothetical protein